MCWKRGKLIYEEEDAHRAMALQWLNAAREDIAAADLILAQLDQPPGLAGPACWHAQQMVEKSLKAVLSLEQIGVPPTHQLDKLVDLLPERMRPWTWNGCSIRAFLAAVRTTADGPRLSTRAGRCLTCIGSMTISWRSFSSAQSSLNLRMTSAHRLRTSGPRHSLLLSMSSVLSR